ncbi:hypothetical protein [Gallaecimonas sp. GXIMD4217]|uniref:hypothetical protein n=1 Tax=Gallaecimonas sp. GXIMD4217 TaxID=3131927 RepID=UPI00311ACC9D
MAEDNKAQLNDILGALVSGVAHARRVADAEVMRIARFYRRHEYLNGLTVPRLRINKIALDLPVLFDDVVPAKPAEANDPAYIAQCTRDALEKSLQQFDDLMQQRHKEFNEEQMALAKSLLDGLPDRLDFFQKMQYSRLQLMKRMLEKSATHEPVSDIVIIDEVGDSTEELLSDLIQEAVHQVAEGLFADNIREKVTSDVLGSDFIKLLVKDVRAQAEDVAVRVPTQPASFTVRVDTESIKNAASPNSVTRLRLVLTEEGLEWSTESDEQGGTSWKLLPE